MKGEDFSRVTVGGERFREVVIETQDGPELKLLCNKPQVNDCYRNIFTGVCEPITQFGELFECFEGSRKTRVLNRAEEILEGMGGDNERIPVQAET